MDFWVRSLMEHGDARAMVCLADECRSRNLRDRAERLYRRAAEDGDSVAMLRLADHLSRTRPDAAQETADWLRKAADAGNPDAIFRLGATGPDRLVATTDSPQAQPSPRGGVIDDAETMVFTVVVTFVLAEFLKTIVAKLAEDTYAGVRAWLARVARGHSPENPEQPPGNTLLLIEDADGRRDLTLHIWLDVSEQALRSLPDSPAAKPRRRRLLRRRANTRRMFWCQHTESWEVFLDASHEE
jgi:hypothetical protein